MHKYDKETNEIQLVTKYYEAIFRCKCGHTQFSPAGITPHYLCRNCDARFPYTAFEDGLYE